MSGSKKMTLRIQSSEGTARVELLDTEVTAQLFERVYDALRLNSFGFALYKDRARKDEIVSSKSRQLREYGLQHGDMLYLTPVNGTVLFDQPSTSVEVNNKPFVESAEAGPSTSSQSSSAPAGVLPKPGGPKEDEVDLQLYQLSGNIQRQRDEKLCRHNSKGCCVHCSPLEPWDENYLKEHNIKHMSFHAYLRKITSGKFISLDEPSFELKPGCKEHPPWPRGICSKCQPGAMTLTRQPYRHVDNVLVEHPAVIERFLAYWRETGLQRIGLLLGRYERHPDVPLGVRARVAAVYEPPQAGARDGVALAREWRDGVPAGDGGAGAALADVAGALGLACVGWIFTDLLPDDVAAGTVRCTRGVDTHFLSAQECIMAGHLQNCHPNACRYSSSGYFGSKFVTVCVTGDRERRVHMEGYQVSGQAQALVRARALLPTRDAPDLGYVRDSADAHYVPDLYYKERDAYGNEVSVCARRVPVAYLLVDVPVGVAVAAAAAPAPALSPRATFPPAHRALPAHLQTPRALLAHVRAAGSFAHAAADVHVLAYLRHDSPVPFPPAAVRELARAVAAGDAAAADRWRAASAEFAALERLADAEPAAPAPAPPRALARSPSASAASAAIAAAAAPVAPQPWTCPLCTYHNAPDHDSCEMCAMPRNNM